MSLKLLIADDDAQILHNSLRQLFAPFGIGETSLVQTPEECRECVFKTEYDIALLDLSFSRGKKEGVDLISIIKERSPQTEVIVLTSFRDFPTIDTCMSQGADDYISKDHLDDFDAISARIRAALERRRKKTVQGDLGDKLAAKVGATFVSKIMRDLYSEVASIRNQASMHVLITGQTGVGKELIARAIARDDEGAPFYPVNSSCFGKDLLEGELFGHERGSFTGADRQKSGLFELASGGDIFLDEIATLSLEHQAKLLRVLQSGEFYRVGGTKVLKTTARVIAATNEDLEAMVCAGSFREDLLQRLQRYHIHVPPLSARKEDIPVIIKAIIKKSGKPDVTITEECLEFLVSNDWKRNVRQLEDCIVSMTLKSDGKTLTIGDLPKTLFMKSKGDEPCVPADQRNCSLLDGSVPSNDFDFAVSRFAEAYIRSAIKRIKKPFTTEKLAAAIGLSKSTLHRRMTDYGIDILTEQKKAARELEWNK